MQACLPVQGRGAGVVVLKHVHQNLGRVTGPSWSHFPLLVFQVFSEEKTPKRRKN